MSSDLVCFGLRVVALEIAALEWFVLLLPAEEAKILQSVPFPLCRGLNLTPSELHRQAFRNT